MRRVHRLALNRARFADAWVPKIRTRLYRVFRSAWEEAAVAVESGRWTMATRERMEGGIREALGAPSLAMAEHGFALAGAEFRAPASRKEMDALEGKARNRITEITRVRVTAVSKPEKPITFRLTDRIQLTAPKPVPTPRGFPFSGTPGRASAARGVSGGSVANHVREISSGISRTIANRIGKATQKALQAIDPRTGMRRAAEAVAKEIRKHGIVTSKAAADRIAKTETVWAYNEGAVQRYMVEGVRRIVWVTARDDRVCEFCEDLDGKTIGIEEDFFTAGETHSVSVTLKDGTQSERTHRYDYTLEHPPAHSLCRCFAVPG